ncbi:metalloregulator ArsR/SmtB family transcription factor [Acinetobacter puyangensis]|uniref:Transcriptional regulator, ArsR family n=1 Tax=Acinetobacter puyangensis TaxID=1096779 RepID=A0A240E5E8_9GAMM|nr:metalloregulator ArsR/SmtB family transcription factor [Acinetobacter puyangensis]SNX43984.1 transcriptional regulator, ArsR family [Acinetobacter puyangensis]
MLPSEKQMQIDFNKINIVTDCLKVLSNPDRLKILCVLINGEINVHNIEKMTDIHQPTLSQQLTVLRKSNLVETRRDGKQIFYQISDEKVLVIMQTLYGLYCQ